jgi:hypothetical protein
VGGSGDGTEGLIVRELMKKFEGIEMEKQKELTEENVEPMDQGIDDIEAQQEMEGLNL